MKIRVVFDAQNEQITYLMVKKWKSMSFLMVKTSV